MDDLDERLAESYRQAHSERAGLDRVLSLLKIANTKANRLRVAARASELRRRFGDEWAVPKLYQPRTRLAREPTESGPSERRIHARESLPESLRDHFDALADDSLYLVTTIVGRAMISYAVIAELVRLGWRK